MSSAELRPGRTGMRTSGSATSSSAYGSLDRARGGRRRPVHSISSTTRSIWRSSSVASVPKSASTSMTPRPRISMWCASSSAARPRSTVGEMRRTSTTSSATRRWPRDDQVERRLALADAALAEDEDAERRAPRRARRAACVSGASRSSSHAVAARMKSAVRSAESRAPATPRAPRRRRSGRAGGGVPLVTTKQATPAPRDRRDARARARSASSVARIADLAVAEHLHAVGMELRQVAGEREPGLLERAAARSSGRGRARPRRAGAPALGPAASSSSRTVTRQYRASSSRMVS